MTRAVILAAGEGTRLRPHTEHLPKTLVPMAGRPLFERQQDVLRRAGIEDLHVVVGHCAPALEGRGARLVVNERYADTNMVASLERARHLFGGDDDVLVAYGDIAYEPRVLAALLASRAPVSVVVDTGWWDLWQLRMDNPLADAETLRLGADDRILELGRKPRSRADIEAQYIGLFKVDRAFAPSFFARYDRLVAQPLFEGRPSEKMYMTSYLQHLIDEGVEVRAVPVAHGWLEVDSVQDLARYEAAQAQGRLAALYDTTA